MRLYIYVVLFSFFVNIGRHTCEIASSAYISAITIPWSSICCILLLHGIESPVDTTWGLHAKTSQHPTSSNIYISIQIPTNT